MSRWIGSWAVAGCLGVGTPVALPVWAEAIGPVVVELYTSQGCSSCPPADAFLAELAGRDDVLPLALHVDYWDYIGWVDSFAQPMFTNRQHSYARAFGERMVYTPQMIVGGVVSTIGNRPMEVMDLIHGQAEARPEVTLRVERTGADLSIEATATAGLAGPILVQVVRFLPEARVEIANGENAGRTIDYYNIVTSWTHVAEWQSAGPLDLDLQVSGEERLAVILQRPGPGRILAAAVVP